jgi:hypothetical protein
MSATTIRATTIRATLARWFAELARRSADPIGTTSGARLR